MALSKSISVPSRPRSSKASRNAILEHAIAEFAKRGAAGARTAEIAKSAGVNKALLYYYFKDKESLYSASLQAVFSGFVGDVMPLLESSLSPGEKMLRFARMHFEYLVANPNYPRFIQQELSRASHGKASEDLRAMSSSHFIPLQQAGMKVIKAGVASGEFRRIQDAGVLRTMFAMNVFYFVSAPIMRMVRGVDPFAPESMQAHIATSLDFIGAAIFADREHGIRLAKKVANAPYACPRALGEKARERVKDLRTETRKRQRMISAGNGR